MFRDEYKKLKELGSGSYGSAFLVQRRDDKNIFHVAKTVKLSHLSEKERSAALQEARHLERISHANIVAYVATYLEEKRLHIVMEYADRGDLAEKIRRRKDEHRTFSESSVMRYFYQLALALEHIHGRSILHRDLKPMNIFLSGPQEQVKLGDFGVARVIDHPSQGAQTQVGTPYYLPPEVINMERYGTSSDLWSLGVVLYELLALRVPFAATSLPGVAVQICNAEPDPLPQEYSQSLRHTIAGLLQKDPQRRPTLRELLRPPRDAGDAWAAAVQRQRRRLQETEVVPMPRPGSSGSDRSGKASPVDEHQRSSSCREEVAGAAAAPRPSSAASTAAAAATSRQEEDAKLVALERARMEALEDRRLARQRALDQRHFSDDVSEAGASHVSSLHAGVTAKTAAGSGRGARAQDDHLQQLARMSRLAAEERAQRLSRGNGIAWSARDEVPPTARRGHAASSVASGTTRATTAPSSGQSAAAEEQRTRDFARASHEAAEERRRLREKHERCSIALSPDGADLRFLLCA